MHILEMYIIYVTYNVYIYICIAYISSHSKGPEQEQLRSPFVPYVRNTAERSIHNLDSGPYIYIYMIIYVHINIWVPMENSIQCFFCYGTINFKSENLSHCDVVGLAKGRRLVRNEGNLKGTCRIASVPKMDCTMWGPRSIAKLVYNCNN